MARLSINDSTLSKPAGSEKGIGRFFFIVTILSLRGMKMKEAMGMSRTENVELTVLCLIEDGDTANWRAVWTPASTAGSGSSPQKL